MFVVQKIIHFNPKGYAINLITVVDKIYPLLLTYFQNTCVSANYLRLKRFEICKFVVVAENNYKILKNMEES